MRKLEIDNKEYLIPGKWSELSKDDLLEFCHISLKGLAENSQRFVLLKYYTGIKYKYLEKLDKSVWTDVLSIFDYLFGESKLITNHLPELEGIKGPDDGLTNFTFDQFLGQAEPYHYAITSGKYEYLDNLINIMYNYNGSDANFEKLKGLNAEIKLAVYLFYQGCSNYIKTRFKAAFPTSTQKKTKPDGLEFVRLVNSLNLGDMSKNEAIKHTNLYEALTYLTTLINKNDGQTV